MVGREGCAAEACKGGDAFNKVYRAAFIEWRTQLAKDLMQCHYNTITSAWCKVGLGSVLDKGCEMWTASIKSFGGGSMLDTVQQAVFRAQQEHQPQQPGAAGGTVRTDGSVAGRGVDEGRMEIEQQQEEEITPRERMNIEKRDRLLHAVRTLAPGVVLHLARHRTPMAAKHAHSGEGGEGGERGRAEGRKEGGGEGSGAVAEEVGNDASVHSTSNLLVLAADVRWRRGVLRITPKSDDEEEFQLSKEQVGDTTNAAVVALCSTYELLEQPSASEGASAQRVKKGNAKLVREPPLICTLQPWSLSCSHLILLLLAAPAGARDGGTGGPPSVRGRLRRRGPIAARRRAGHRGRALRYGGSGGQGGPQHSDRFACEALPRVGRGAAVPGHRRPFSV